MFRNDINSAIFMIIDKMVKFPLGSSLLRKVLSKILRGKYMFL
jgi:hypothetical protein